jgi:hypothetical protein
MVHQLAFPSESVDINSSQPSHDSVKILVVNENKNIKMPDYHNFIQLTNLN